jgi:RecA/RadA recombinase
MTDFLSALKSAGLKTVELASDASTMQYGFLNTGNLALNFIISGKFRSGGWPLGHVSEIYGDPSTGKSYLVNSALSQVLRLGGQALLDDTEHSFNAVWAASNIGVATDQLVITSSHLLEEHHKAVKAFCDALRAIESVRAKKSLPRTPSAMALDSIALLTSEEEVKGGIKPYLKRAQVIKQLMRLMAFELHSVGAAYIVANHTIANIGDPWKTTTSSGGGGIKFQSTVRLELRSPKPLKYADAKTIAGVRIIAYAEKTRSVAPWQSIQMIIPFHQPISPVSGLINLLLDRGFIGKTKAHRITYQEEDTGIFAYASDLWKQDQSALDLLSKYPNCLDEIESRPFVPPTGPMKDGDAEPEESTE